MRITIDTNNKSILTESGGQKEEFSLYSKEAFELVSNLWVKIGWNEQYAYTFSWMGRPVIQLPEDMIRMQEVIYRIKPDVIIETGVAHGGSLIYYSSLCKVIGKGRVIGVDIEIRTHNRKAIEEHELFENITLIEGDSTSDDVLNAIEALIKKDDTVLVILDSNHTREHVLKELEKYSKFVVKGSYIVATDGIMQDLYDTPRGDVEWETDNPVSAVQDFIKGHSDFVVEYPEWIFNESELTTNITHWPSAWLRKL